MGRGKKKPKQAARPDRFGSFADLRRSRDGGEGKTPEGGGEDSGRGWSLSTEDSEEQEARVGTDPDLGGEDRVRLRVDERPSGWGPMLPSPWASPVYGDAQSEEMELLHSFRVRTVFPADVCGEADSLPQDPGRRDTDGRLDLRGETLFTIDGEDARDYDDAVSIRALDGGAVEVGVHIADVSHYVRPGTALDDEALARATSVYLPDQVVPMLPESLSNGLCSLVADRDRLAWSVRMTFDAKGQRTEAHMERSVVRSLRRCTYEEVQQLLDGAHVAADLALLEKPLRLLASWTRKQQELRDAAGSLRIQSTERKFLFNAKHEVRAIVDAPRYFSQTLIEETALAANQAVGDRFLERGLPTLYRVHPEKDPEEVAAVVASLEEHNIRVPQKERLTGRDIGRLIRAARGRPNGDALVERIMGLVERATYEVRDDEQVAEHFGLARRAYLHFTSPIRRYPDLIVHRWLGDVATRGKEAEAELKTDAMVAELGEVARHASLRAELAEMASSAVTDLKVCQFMDPHVGETIGGRIHRVSRGGLVVHLSDYNVRAFLPARRIGDRPFLKGSTLTVRRGRATLSFSEGQPIRVKVGAVDFIRLEVVLGMP
jgi:ribonuclease R